MWAGENRRNALRMESVYAIDPDSILTSVVEGSFRKNRRKIKKRERRIHNKEDRDRRDDGRASRVLYLQYPTTAQGTYLTTLKRQSSRHWSDDVVFDENFARPMDFPVPDVTSFKGLFEYETGMIPLDSESIKPGPPTTRTKRALESGPLESAAKRPRQTATRARGRGAEKVKYSDESRGDDLRGGRSGNDDAPGGRPGEDDAPGHQSGGPGAETMTSDAQKERPSRTSETGSRGNAADEPNALGSRLTSRTPSHRWMTRLVQ